MANIFDITQFGAIGDGKTDCTQSIQAAINEAEKCGGSVDVPPGRYLTGKLTLQGVGVSIIGRSAWSYRRDGTSVFILNDENADCLLDISGSYSTMIKGMCFDGRYLGKNIHGIKLAWEDYHYNTEEDTPTIDDCRIGCFSGNGVHYQKIWCFSIRHSMLHRNTGAGLYVDGCDGFILDNWFSANKNGGILGDKIIASVTLTGNRVEWNNRGGFIFPHGDAFNITGNFFDRTFGPALDLGSEQGELHTVAVTGNVFRRGGAYNIKAKPTDPSLLCHINMKNCNCTTITGNAMHTGINDDGTPPRSPDYAFVIEDCQSCIVKDNSIYNGYMEDAVLLVGDSSTCIIDCNI